jgi:hypothetical protein
MSGWLSDRVEELESRSKRAEQHYRRLVNLEGRVNMLEDRINQQRVALVALCVAELFLAAGVVYLLVGG